MSDNSKKTFILPKITGLGFIIIGIILTLPFTVSVWQGREITLVFIRDLLFGFMLIIAGRYIFLKSRNQAQRSQS